MDTERPTPRKAVETSPSDSETAIDYSYFRVQSYWGATKHMGGFKATQELVRMCKIAPGKRILEVGCGSGMTSWRLAKEYDCYLVGVDLSEEMITWSKKRAAREKVTDRTEFRVANAEKLPFEDNDFDIVLCESVTAFPEEKQKVVYEYARVVRPGGFVGMNEGTWLVYPPPQDLTQYLKKTMENAEFLTAESWENLMETAGLVDIQNKVYELSMLEQWRNQMAGLSAGDRKDTLKAFRSFFSLFLRDPMFRKYAREISPSPGMMRKFLKFFGYGLYVGRKV